MAAIKPKSSRRSTHGRAVEDAGGIEGRGHPISSKTVTTQHPGMSVPTKKIILDIFLGPFYDEWLILKV